MQNRFQKEIIENSLAAALNQASHLVIIAQTAVLSRQDEKHDRL
jgi:rRNA maturation protein Rpf1